MFKRFMNIIRGKADEGLKKLETPEVLAQQAQDEIETSVKKVKEALIDGMTSEKGIQKKLEEDAKKAAEWQKRAELAISQDRDDLAKECLQKRKDCLLSEESQKEQLEAQKAANANLKKKLKDLEKELRDFMVKKKNMIARAQAGDALASASDSLSSTGGSSSSMDALEAKIRQKEARNEAIRELDGMEDDLQLEEQFLALEDGGGGASDIDLELLELKKQMDSTKLIGTSKGKESDEDDSSTGDEVEVEAVDAEIAEEDSSEK